MPEQKTTSGKYPNRGLGAKLREHFAKHPGQTFYLGDLAQKFGVTEEATQQRMYDLVSRFPGFEVEIRGRAWRWRPQETAANAAPPASSKRMFEEIGPAKDGSIVIQDDGGKLYRATEL